jgi:hypothetical protein
LTLLRASNALNNKLRNVMRIGEAIKRRLRALEKKLPPTKWDLRDVPFDDLVALERVFGPARNFEGGAPKISKRLFRLITKLEADAQQPRSAGRNRSQ